MARSAQHGAGAICWLGWTSEPAAPTMRPGGRHCAPPTAHVSTTEYRCRHLSRMALPLWPLPCPSLSTGINKCITIHVQTTRLLWLFLRGPGQLEMRIIGKSIVYALAQSPSRQKEGLVCRFPVRASNHQICNVPTSNVQRPSSNLQSTIRNTHSTHALLFNCSIDHVCLRFLHGQIRLPVRTARCMYYFAQDRVS